MKRELRSNCPISASLDILGDRWTVLILRDMLLTGKTQYGDFASAEGIATNILADRLNNLVDRGIIERVPDDQDRRKFHYRPLTPGIELLPMISELVIWGARHTPVPPNPAYQAMLDEKTRSDFVTTRSAELLAEL